MRLLVGVMLSMFALCGFAADLGSKGKARQFTDSVMADVGAGRLDAALGQLKSYASVAAGEFKRIEEELLFQIPEMEKRFGKAIGVEFLASEDAGDSLYALSYLQKFERHAVRWRFLFYRPRDRWVLNSFATDDNLQLLFSD